MIGGVDRRKPLSAAMLSMEYERCAKFTCMEVLRKGEKSCVGCFSRSWRTVLCLCKHCGASYAVNRQQTCSHCEKNLPHSSQYEQQRHNADMQEVQAVKKNASLTLTKLSEVLQNELLSRVFLDGRGKTDSITRMVQGTAELRNIIMGETESAAFNEEAALAPFESLTSPFLAENIEGVSMCKYGVLGQGLSLWQMMPFEEPWCTKLYYIVGSCPDGVSSAGKAKRTPVAKLKLLRQFISISEVNGTIENMTLVRSRYGNSAFGEEIRDCGRIVEMFYMSRGNIQGKREKTAALSRFVDIIDQEMQRQIDLIKEIVRVSRLHDCRL